MTFKRISICVAIAGPAILALLVICYIAGARVNTTKSLRVGLYWTSSAPVEKGAYVLFCPPPRDVFDEAKKRGYISTGPCPGDYCGMMKRVFAAKDDVVTVADDGVFVNGKLLPYSVPLAADMGGRPLPRFRINNYKLSDDELLLMTDVSAISFDSRYFGLIKRSQIKTVIRPIFTW